jgi:hypothetical protein
LIHLVEHSALPVRRTLDALGLAPSTFYRWYEQFQKEGEAGLATKPSARHRFWNRIPETVLQQIVQLALAHPSRRLGSWPGVLSARKAILSQKPAFFGS